MAVVEQCTYDCTIHNAEMILKRIGHLCDYILFDEAWAGFMKFHPLYAGRYAWASRTSVRTRRHHRHPVHPQAAGELLAGLADPHEGPAHHRQKRRVEHRRFNESFMQHASPSPFYSAVRLAGRGRADYEGPLGRSAVGRHHSPRHRLRKKIRATRREFEEKESRPERRWFFEPFVPERVAIPDAARPGAVA